MKKTLLLALVASAVSVATTTGHVKAYNKNETVIKKVDNSKANEKLSDYVKGTITTLGIETEVKVVDSGLSFGGKIEADKLGILMGIATPEEVFDDILLGGISVWSKYELPEIKGIKSYVKGTFNPTGIRQNGKIDLSATTEVELDAQYKVMDDVTVGLNSKTKVYLPEIETSETVKKVYVKANTNIVKDIEGDISYSYKYNKPVSNFVTSNLKGSYKEIKDLTLTGKFNFVHALNDYLYEYKEDDAEFLLNGYLHKYTLEALYKGVKDTEIKGSLYVRHLLQHSHGVKDENSNIADIDFYSTTVGIRPEFKYEGIKDLVLTSKNRFEVVHNIAHISPVNASQAKSKQTMTHYNLGFNLGGVYTYKATEKLTVKPGLELSFDMFELQKNSKDSKIYMENSLEIVPKVETEYKANDNLTFNAGVEATVLFDNTLEDKEQLPTKDAKFKYENTNLKTNLSVKYTW